jgi:calcium-dependent protein kinase
LGSLLGAGGFGEVYSCEHIETGAERAVKVLVKSLDDPKADEVVIKEFNMLRSLDSPNLLKVYEMFEDELHFYIVSDLYKGGDLLEELEEGGILNEDCAAALMNAVLSCVSLRLRTFF